MAATGYTPISLYYSATASAVPLAANLTAGELALNTNDGKLYYKNSSNVVTQIAGAGGPAGGSSGQVQYNSSGALAGSANLLFSGTDLTVYGIRVGRGGGAESLSTAVGASALAANTSGSGNTAVGYQALIVNTTGNYNVAIGPLALNLNTTGGQNIAMGLGALEMNTTGSNNVAIGQQAGGRNTTASQNTAVGYQAGYNTTTGANNTAMGYVAFTANSTGANNVAIGSSALQSNTTASSSTAVGYVAGQFNTTGQITAIGNAALQNNSTGTQSTAVGINALITNTTGGNNTAVGMQALNNNTTASNNTAVGYQAGYGGTTAAGNVSFGRGAGYTLTTGYGNTFIGTYAGSSVSTGVMNTFIGPTDSGYTTASGAGVTTGSKNVILGGYAGSAAPISATGSNYIVLSDGDGNVRQTIDSTGNVGIGTTSPQSKLHVYTGASGVTPNSESKLTVESSGTAAIGILAPAASESIVYFGSPTSNVDGGIVYNHTSRNMIFRTAGNTNRMRMDSTGRLIIGADTANASESKLEVRGPANTGLSIYMLKATQVEVNMGFGGGGDSNFYINSGSATIGTSGVYLTNAGNSWSSVSDERMKTIVAPIENASAKLATLRTVIGYFNNDTTQTRRPFLIAQDVQAVLPEAVNVQNLETGTLGMSYTDTIPLLVAAINELKAEFDAYKSTHP